MPIGFLKGLFCRDRVVLRFHDKQHMIKPVEWIYGVPFAAPYLPKTRCELLPDGKVIGQDYIDSWLPASEKMEEFYYSNHIYIPKEENGR